MRGTSVLLITKSGRVKTSSRSPEIITGKKKEFAKDHLVRTVKTQIRGLGTFYTTIVL